MNLALIDRRALRAEAGKVASDLVAASTVYTHAIEGAAEVFRAASLDDQARAIERICELHRLHHAQLDLIAARLSSTVGAST